MSDHNPHLVTAYVARRTWHALEAAHRRGVPELQTSQIGRDTGQAIVFVACHVVDEYPLFDLGQVVATPGSLRELERMGLVPSAAYGKLLERHCGGDWGVLTLEDHEHNDLAMDRGDRILSAYDLYGTRFWLITEADRSVTTLLLPEEY